MILLDSHLVIDTKVLEILGILLLIIVGLFLIYIVRIHIAYRMAKNRHRDPLPWVLLSFFFSPLITWLLLLAYGDADNRRPSE